MSEEQSGGVTVIYSGEQAVNFPKARYISVDAQGCLALHVDSQNEVAFFPPGAWKRVFNLNADQPKWVSDPGDSQ